MTIKEIAEIAGVSIATVSLALNNKGSVKKETRKRILELAHEQGYTKKRQDIKKNILLIKYVSSGISIEKNGDFVAKMIDAIEQTSSEHGYNINIKNILASDWQESIYSINQEDFSGIIFLSTEAEENLGEQIKTIKIPIVAVDNMFETVDIDTVSIDNSGGVYEAVKYAYDLGHRKIGYINSSVKFTNIMQRKEGFRKALKNLNIEFDQDYIIEAMPTLDGSYENMLQMLKNKIKLPTLYITGNDTIAIGAIKAFKEYGLNVPEDISVIGFDDLPFCTMMDSPLTTMSVNKKSLGERAVKLLIEKMDGINEDTVKLLLRPKLVERASVKRI
ncbi:MAG: LacI family DNA-binding transcriptional regulator [Proteocatella sp.]